MVDLLIISPIASKYCSVNLKLRASDSLAPPIIDEFIAPEMLFKDSQRLFASYNIFVASPSPFKIDCRLFPSAVLILVLDSPSDCKMADLLDLSDSA